MFHGEIVATYAEEECLENGRPNALKVKPRILMDTGYFDLNNIVGSIFKSFEGNRKAYL